MDAGAIDPGSAMPKYRQLANWLREKIQAGELTRLPSEKALAAEHKVAKGTVRQALDVLRAEGLVKTYPGSGTEAVQPCGGEE